MAEYANMIARGGNFRGAFGLRIAGLDDCFVDDVSRSQFGTFGWTPSTDHVSQLGLASELGITISEKADWRGAKLSAEGMRLVVRDTGGNERASRAFGGRQPSMRTFLTADISAAETTAINVVSTAGWPSSGTVHIGREAIAYAEITSATVFGDLTRGMLGTLACVHDSGSGGIEVTDVPAAMERRLCQLSIFTDSVASASATTLWRGIVESVREVPEQVGYELQVGHISALLDQDFGSNLADFGIRGYYFPSLDPLYVIIDEMSDNAFIADGVGYEARITLSGFYETLDDIATALTAQLRDSANWWKAADGTTGTAPVNEEYSCQVRDGGLTFSFRADATTPFAATIRRSHDLIGCNLGNTFLEGPDGSHIALTAWDIAAGYEYTLRRETPLPMPLAYTKIGSAPGGRVIIGEPTYPSNRVYYTPGAPTTITDFWPFADIDRIFTVTDVDTSAGFFTISLERFYELVVVLADTPDNTIKLEAITNYGQHPWHDVFRTLVEATPTTGASGETPWLPESEFDLDDIERESLAAGAASFIGDWKVTKATSLRKLFDPHLLMLGLCWVSGYDGRLTVRMIDVTTDAANANGEYTDREGDWALTVGTESARDGVVNVCRVKSGYDPRSGEWAATGSGAFEENSIAVYDKVAIEIEPINGELTDVSYETVLASALAGARIVATHAYPYVHATLSGIPGLKLARLLVGDTLSVTDQRIPWRGARRTCVAERSQIVSRTVRYYGDGAPGIDFVVRLSGWDAAGYAPAARITYNSLTTGAAGANTRFVYRAENWYSDAPRTGATKYDGAWFRVGDIVKIREQDVATENKIDGLTIVAIDTTNRTIDVDASLAAAGINTAGKIFVVEPDIATAVADAANDANTPAQRAYCYTADAVHEIDGDPPARVYAA